MAQDLEFIKMHGTGNDFVVVDASANGARAWVGVGAQALRPELRGWQ